jgi:hypothetical protein
MADSSVTTGPETPATPTTIRVDGDLGAVEFVRRLHRGGLELRNAEDGSYAVILRAEREPQPVSGVRTRLFEAQSVVHCVRHAITTSDAGLDDAAMTYALTVAARIIDDVAGELEGWK